MYPNLKIRIQDKEQRVPTHRLFCLKPIFGNSNKQILFKDFNFDGRLNLRLLAGLSPNQSKKLDLILLCKRMNVLKFPSN